MPEPSKEEVQRLMEAAERLERNPDYLHVANYFGDLAGRRVVALDPHIDVDDILATLKAAQAILGLVNTVASLAKGLKRG